METFSALLALCEGISPVTGEFPAQRPVTRSFDVYIDLRLNKQICAWINNGKAGDLRCYRGDYDVIVMYCYTPLSTLFDVTSKMGSVPEVMLLLQLVFWVTYTS